MVNSDQFNSECEKVSLSDNNNAKKFKIININQAANMSSERMDEGGSVGEGNKFGHKTQLIEIDKLIINNGPPTQQQKKSSKNGVWHQVSLLSLRSFLPSSKNYFSTSAALLLHGWKTFFMLLLCFALNECCGTFGKFSAHTKVLFVEFFPLPVPFIFNITNRSTDYAKDFLSLRCVGVKKKILMIKTDTGSEREEKV
jgi:hypothetical protein